MEQFLTWLDEAAADALARSRALALDARRDEADHEKIRANVCAICRSVFTALDGAAARRKLAGLREAWQGALAQAHSHGGTEKAAVEQIKLSQLGAVEAALAGADSCRPGSSGHGENKA